MPRPKDKAAPAAWRQAQERIAELRIQDDDMDWFVDEWGNIEGLHQVAGLDISRFPESEHAVAAVVVLSFPDMQVLYAKCVAVHTTVPYIPNFLAFREAPPLVALIEGLPKKMKPQLVFCDGNGAYHPRRCGVATHLGVALGIPAVGIAKKVLQVGAIKKSYAYKVAEKLRAPGEWLPLTQHECCFPEDDPGRLAAVLRPGCGQWPLVVSPGHRISLRSAAHVAAAVCKWGKVAEPIHQADLKSRAAVKAWLAGYELPTLKIGDPRRVPEIDSKTGNSVLLPVVDKLIQRRAGKIDVENNNKAPKPGSSNGHSRWVPVRKASDAEGDAGAEEAEAASQQPPQCTTERYEQQSFLTWFWPLCCCMHRSDL
mmetsp:Transcript_36819/g.84828  ORF Transcript_36819/g.84828 Transcript_36819/m.84828 type:complete len:369 (-) Transcript_36819:158-1264(-)